MCREEQAAISKPQTRLLCVDVVVQKTSHSAMEVILLTDSENKVIPGIPAEMRKTRDFEDVKAFVRNYT